MNEKSKYFLDQDTPYRDLNPECILESIETLGFKPTGSMIGLNSYENRVYQLGLEDGSFCVVKFYRPNRWTDEEIMEEHNFTNELKGSDLSVISPYITNGQSLFEYKTFRFSIFPRQGGHTPNIENLSDLKVLARSIARLHSIGQTSKFKHRGEIDILQWSTESRESIINHQIIPLELENNYRKVTLELIEKLEKILVSYNSKTWSRIHGDFHLGNVLWRDNTAHLLDFDDTINGPPIQDLWMLLSGTRMDQEHQLYEILDAYNTFYDFDHSDLILIEPLRTARIMHHAAWIGKRWNDPAFPLAFPWYNTNKYWMEHILDLRQQITKLDEPNLNPN